MEKKIVPAVAAVSKTGLMHLPGAVRLGLGLGEGERVVFFVDREKRRAVLVPESSGFQFPE